MDECLPLKTLDELFNWKQSGKRHVTLPLLARKKSGTTTNTLLCHDMKGGYLEDRFVHGVQKKNCFAFIHWSLIDIFVYFSHCLVTIPPCSWINAAHKNGVKILGTFITESDQGVQICQRALSSSDTVNKMCRKLVDIALTHGFDGWLINIENQIDRTKMPLLKQFVEVLTETMHKAKPNSLVIWYDSVIEGGELKWQNALNEKNRSFFNVCDGIFLNYNWNEENLTDSGAEAGSRLVDVYVGVDVFGRGCFGGGGFSTNLAVERARDHGLSVAIFAIGWVYECLEPEEYMNNQYRFWDLLLELCPAHILKSLPFSTTFCPGFGEKMFRNGKVISDQPWHNLSLQQIQPAYFFESTALSVYFDDAIAGGGSLLFSPLHMSAEKPCIYRVFLTHFVLNDLCFVKYCFKRKAASPDVKFDVVLDMWSFKRKDYSLCLDGGQEVDDGIHFFTVSLLGKETVLLPAPPDAVHVEDAATKECEGWTTRKYLLPLSTFNNSIIKGITARIFGNYPMNVDVGVLLGEFEIGYAKPKIDFRCANIEKVTEVDKMQVKCCLEWNKPSSGQFCDLYYQLEGQGKTYLNTTFQTFLNVDLALERTENATLQFVLVPDGKTDDQQVISIEL